MSDETKVDPPKPAFEQIEGHRVQFVTWSTPEEFRKLFPGLPLPTELM